MAWGMGPVLALTSFGGMLAAGARALRTPPSRAEWVVLSWALPFFAFTGALFVKFPRYWLPLGPTLALYSARGIVRLGRRRLFPATGVALASILPAWAISGALVASYRLPHPWVMASQWLREHLPPGSRIAVEAWDHPLPLDSTGYDLLVLPVFDPETSEKRAVMERILAEADALVIASHRGYGALARWPRPVPLDGCLLSPPLLRAPWSFTPRGVFPPPSAPVGPPLTDNPFRAAGLPCSPIPNAFRAPRSRIVAPAGREFLTVYDRPTAVIFLKGNSHHRTG